MKVAEIGVAELRVLEMFDYVANRFEAEAGFPLPGLSAMEISEVIADEFGAGYVDEKRLEDLERLGFLSRLGLPGKRGYYSLTEFGEFAASACSATSH